MKPKSLTGGSHFSSTLKTAPWKDRIALVLAAWFGSGLVPRAPGTAGTAAGYPLILLVFAAGPLVTLGLLVVLIPVSIWAAGRAERILDLKDPSLVVIDEVAGMALGLAFLPLSIPVLIIGFILFRIFDIIKPFPVRRLEQFPGGTGIVLDDLMAGVYTHLGLRILLLIVPAWGTGWV
jgi:phosphatidylglycerophosphatase A